MIPAITPPLLHTALVERSASAGESPSRQRLPPRWTTQIEAMPCNYWVPEQLPLRGGSGGLREGPNADLVADGPRVLVSRHAGVKVGDRLRNIRAGEDLVEAGPMAVVDDLWRRTHRELALELAGPKAPPAEAS